MFYLLKGLSRLCFCRPSRALHQGGGVGHVHHQQAIAGPLHRPRVSLARALGRRRDLLHVDELLCACDDKYRGGLLETTGFPPKYTNNTRTIGFMEQNTAPLLYLLSQLCALLADEKAVAPAPRRAWVGKQYVCRQKQEACPFLLEIPRSRLWPENPSNLAWRCFYPRNLVLKMGYIDLWSYC